MDANELIQRYEEGVRFECGCEEMGLHPSVRAGLTEGSIRPAALMYCPVHASPMLGAPRVPVPRIEPLIFE